MLILYNYLNSYTKDYFAYNLTGKLNAYIVIDDFSVYKNSKPDEILRQKQLFVRCVGYWLATIYYVSPQTLIYTNSLYNLQ